MTDILKIFCAVVMAQFMRAVILGTVWHIRELRNPNNWDAHPRKFVGSSFWSKIQSVY
jgi:hypothetical protein